MGGEADGVGVFEGDFAGEGGEFEEGGVAVLAYGVDEPLEGGGVGVGGMGEEFAPEGGGGGVEAAKGDIHAIG